MTRVSVHRSTDPPRLCLCVRLSKWIVQLLFVPVHVCLVSVYSWFPASTLESLPLPPVAILFMSCHPFRLLSCAVCAFHLAVSRTPSLAGIIIISR